MPLTEGRIQCDVNVPAVTIKNASLLRLVRIISARGINVPAERTSKTRTPKACWAALLQCPGAHTRRLDIGSLRIVIQPWTINVCLSVGTI